MFPSAGAGMPGMGAPLKKRRTRRKKPAPPDPEAERQERELRTRIKRSLRTQHVLRTEVEEDEAQRNAATNRRGGGGAQATAGSIQRTNNLMMARMAMGFGNNVGNVQPPMGGIGMQQQGKYQFASAQGRQYGFRQSWGGSGTGGNIPNMQQQMERIKQQLDILSRQLEDQVKMKKRMELEQQLKIRQLLEMEDHLMKQQLEIQRQQLEEQLKTKKQMELEQQLKMKQLVELEERLQTKRRMMLRQQQTRPEADEIEAGSLLVGLRQHRHSPDGQLRSPEKTTSMMGNASDIDEASADIACKHREPTPSASDSAVAKGSPNDPDSQEIKCDSDEEEELGALIYRSSRMARLGARGTGDR